VVSSVSAVVTEILRLKYMDIIKKVVKQGSAFKSYGTSPIPSDILMGI